MVSFCWAKSRLHKVKIGVEGGDMHSILLGTLKANHLFSGCNDLESSNWNNRFLYRWRWHNQCQESNQYNPDKEAQIDKAALTIFYVYLKFPTFPT